MRTTKFVDRNISGLIPWLKFLFLSFGICLTASLFAQTPASSPSDTKDANKLYLTGLAFAKEGKLDQAISTFETALERDRRNLLLLDAAGAAYSLKGDLKRAENYFLKCLERDPGFVPAHKNLAIAYFIAGEYDLATVELQKLKGSSPASTPVANLFLGIIAEKNGNHTQAAKFLEASGILLDRYPEAILSLADAELQLSQLQKAHEALAKLDIVHVITGPQRFEAAELYSGLAHAAQKNGDLGLAMQSLRQAAKLNPMREDNYLDFSSICADYGNYPLALEAANIGLEHVPNSYRLLIQKGVMLENLARFEEAESILRDASEVQKDNSVALLSLGIVQTHAGQLWDAEATLNFALGKFPDNYYMHYHLGKILLQLQEGNPDGGDLTTEAIHAFQEAIRCNPSYADSYYQLSKLYLHESPKLAEQNLVKCLRLDPNHAPAEYELARLYLSTGRRTEGQVLIDRFERQRQADKVKDNQKPRIELAQN